MEPTVESLTAQLETTKAQLELAKRDGEDLARIRGEVETTSKALKEAQERIKATEEDGKVKITEVSTKASEKLVNAELKSAAIAAGARNFADVLALVERGKVKLDDNGELENGDELIAALKKDKPYLFGRTQSTHTDDVAPKPKGGTGQKHAKDMTKEEWADERKRLGLR